MQKHYFSQLLKISGAALVPLVSTTAAFSQQTANVDSVPNRLPPIVVTGSQPTNNWPGGLQEERPVGDYGQPSWTTARRFPGTRIYLQQTAWNVGVEQWVRFQHFRDGSDYTRFQEEIEVGLPHRFQVDLYETWGINQDWRAGQDEVSVEVRYALADWGVIPLNPTLYVEYAQHDHDANTLEGKLLLGTDITPRWHWGLNLACEQELGQPNNTELAASQGISYSLLDDKLGAGVEMEYYHEKSTGSPGANVFLIGPSVQWHITPRIHLDLAPLFGVTHSSSTDVPTMEAFFVLGYDFGSMKSEHYAPASLRGQ